MTETQQERNAQEDIAAVALATTLAEHEGEMEWQFEKDAAERTVRSLYMVGVSSTVTVTVGASPLELKCQIEAALERCPETDAEHIHVEVRHGRVILRGTVRSLAERNAAATIAWAAPGTVIVDTYLTVEP